MSIAYTFNKLQSYLSSIYQVDYTLRCEKIEFYLKNIFHLLKLKSKNSITYSSVKSMVVNIVLRIIKNYRFAMIKNFAVKTH